MNYNPSIAAQQSLLTCTQTNTAWSDDGAAANVSTKWTEVWMLWVEAGNKIMNRK